MRRMELQEIHDHPRFPVFLRDLVTDALQSLWEFGNCYRPILGRLLAGMDRAGTHEVLDLCSGGGGPWPRLAREPELRSDAAIAVRLTDKYPNRSGLAWASAVSTLVEFESKPVDAMNIPATLRGFRTIFSSFHHFGPDEARAMLAGAAAEGQGIGIFEIAGRSLKTMLIVCFLPLVSCLLAPSIRPFRWSRLVWTYLIPVVPFVLLYDGLVSCLRSYSHGELEELVESLGSESYSWEIGEERDGFLTVTYLVGYPADRVSSGFDVDDAMTRSISRR